MGIWLASFTDSELQLRMQYYPNVIQFDFVFMVLFPNFWNKHRPNLVLLSREKNPGNKVGTALLYKRHT